MLGASSTLRAQPSLVKEFIVPQGTNDADSHLKLAYARLDEYALRHMTETGVPGLTVALAGRNGLMRAATYGMADLKTGTRVAPETMFEIGSISKSFVAGALLQLRDEGKLDLRKPVKEYLPWLKINSRYEPVTVHHLLSHTAGLTAVPLLSHVLFDELLVGPAPGSRFIYSNTGYNILGFLLETLDGRPFAEAMQRRMLTPLGMTVSAPAITNDTRPRMAVGYEPLFEDRPFPLKGTLAEAPWIEVDIAAGSIASTPADMARYIQMLIGRGQTPRARIISKESFKLLTSPVIKAPFRGEDASYGYGLWVSDIAGHTRLRHTGGMVAFSSALDVDLNDGLGVFASANVNLRGYRPVAVARHALDLMRASMNGSELPPAPAAPPPPDEVKNAAEYAGTYTAPDGKKLVLAAEADKLFLVHQNQRIALERAGRDLFIVKHTDFALFRLGFVRDKASVTEAFHGANWFAGERYTGPRAFDYPKEWVGYAGHYYNDSPWYRTTRVVLRKGRLWLEGVDAIVPLEANLFRPDGEESTPERIRFEEVINGRAMRMNFSGIIFHRVFTP